MKEGTADLKTLYWFRRWILLKEGRNTDEIEDKLAGYDAMLITSMEYPSLLLERDLIASAVSKGFGGDKDDKS